jgi:hypothetical protein
MEQTTGVSATTRVSLEELLKALECLSSGGIGTVDAEREPEQPASIT